VRPDPADRDPADRSDSQQQAVYTWLLVQNLDHVQDEHREPRGIHGRNDANRDRDVPDITVPP
jgi:hypothetical protein